MSEEPTQKTEPRGINPETGKAYEPIEIPVPKREDFDKLIRKAANTRPHSTDDKPR